ncbi:aldo/keto reductase [Alphaproteobacteria bacterium]|nr:aldo/keto reductase [Alphaproteobacteria bacterium]
MTNPFEVSRITLGAVQLGLPYGAVPASSMPDETETKNLLSAAWDAGINTVDTARTYGVSEERIGHWLSEVNLPLVIATKFPELPTDIVLGPEALRNHLSESRSALGTDHIRFYLAHHAPDILRPEIQDTLRALQEAGQIGGFGASVYKVSEAEAALSVTDLCALQMPINLADQRFVKSGVVAQAAARGVAVFARSVFLQGVLLREPTTLPTVFGPAIPCLTRFGQCCLELGLSKLSAALIAVDTILGITSLVVGVNRRSQLEEIRLALLAAKKIDAGKIEGLLDTLIDFPAGLQDPRDW